VTNETAPPSERPLRNHGARDWRRRGDWLLREATHISWRRVLIDIYRVRWGRRFELVQPDDEADLPSASSDFADFEQGRIDRVWVGLLILGERHFERESDAMTLLRLLREEGQLSWGARWPIGRMVELLNRDSPNPLWSARRVDNAKVRIGTWIGGLKRHLGLSWDYAAQIPARVENDILPLLDELIAAGRDDVPRSRDDLRGLASFWTESDRRFASSVVDALRAEDRIDLQQCASEVSSRLVLSGPAMRLLKLIAESVLLQDSFNDPTKQWDSGKIKTILNQFEGGSFWTVGKVEEAKREMQSWLKSVKSLGIDLFDLEVLFSRVAERSKE
jgi:hypothetical protein